MYLSEREDVVVIMSPSTCKGQNTGCNSEFRPGVRSGTKMYAKKQQKYRNRLEVVAILRWLLSGVVMKHGSTVLDFEKSASVSRTKK